MILLIMNALNYFLHCQHYVAMRVKTGGVTGIISIWRWAKMIQKFLYLCYETIF